MTGHAGAQPGREMVAAGYCLYGSSCSMVLSVGGEPAHFTLDPSLGEFVLTSPQLAVPPKGSIYSVNEGNASLWDAATARWAGMPWRPPPRGFTGHAKACRALLACNRQAFMHLVPKRKPMQGCMAGPRA